jgi:hypothetical protein
MKFNFAKNQLKQSTENLKILELTYSIVKEPKNLNDTFLAGWSWWAWDDSNIRPHAYQACALTN